MGKYNQDPANLSLYEQAKADYNNTNKVSAEVKTATVRSKFDSLTGAIEKAISDMVSTHLNYVITYTRNSIFLNKNEIKSYLNILIDGFIIMPTDGKVYFFKEPKFGDINFDGNLLDIFIETRVVPNSMTTVIDVVTPGGRGSLTNTVLENLPSKLKNKIKGFVDLPNGDIKKRVETMQGLHKEIIRLQKELIELVEALKNKTTQIKIAETELAEYKKAETNKEIYLSAGKLPNGAKSYPKDFFNIPNPSGTFIDIQVRTNYDKTKDLKDLSIWESITSSKNNNFFEQMTIEDEGLVQLNLSLTDINFAELEEILNRTILLSNITKQSLEQAPNGNKVVDLSFNPNFGVNLRIRFGYGHLDVNYIDYSDLSLDFANRIESPNHKKTVIRSPWLYFQLVGINYVVSDIGLTANILAWEIRQIPLKQLQLVKRNSVLIASGPTAAKEMIGLLEAELKKVFINDKDQGVEIRLDYRTIDKNITESDWSKAQPYPIIKNIGGVEKPDPGEIRLVLGDKESDFRYNNGTKNFKSIDELLKDFCNQIEPIYLDSKGYPTKDKKNAAHQAPLIFTYNKKDKKIIINFFFDNKLETANQPSFRIYEWRETKDSIIESLSINSSLDFAQLNAPIYNLSDNSLTGINSLISPTQANTIGISTGDLTTGADFSLVGRVISSGNSTRDELINRFRNTMDRAIFEGEITIPGDPFYIFDDKVQPYKYGIYVYINRNGYLTKDGKYVTSDRSYLSGFYIIKKITHTIDSNGFKTKLNVTKYPLVDMSILRNARAKMEELQAKLDAARAIKI